VEPHEQKLEEVYRLTKENNRMLHSMRRSAFIGGVIKILLYVAFLVVIPYWLYNTYLAPIVESTMEAANQIQGTGAQVQTQFGDLQEALDKFDLTQYIGR
jgi:hypothetical protein